MQGITKKEKGPGHLNLKASRRSRPDAASDDPETGGESPTIIARSAARARRNGEPCAVFFLRQPASFSSPPPWPGDPLKGSRSIVPRCVAPASQPATTERPPRPGSRPAPTAAQFNFAGILYRMPPGRSAGLQRRLQLLQWGLRCFGGNPIRRRHPESNGLLQPLLQAVQGLSRPASLRHKHDRLPIGRSASIYALSAPPPLLKSRGNAPKPNGLTLPST